MGKLKCCFACLDDVLAASANPEQHAKDGVSSSYPYIDHIEYKISIYTLNKYKTERVNNFKKQNKVCFFLSKTTTVSNSIFCQGTVAFLIEVYLNYTIVPNIKSNAFSDIL